MTEGAKYSRDTGTEPHTWLDLHERFVQFAPMLYVDVSTISERFRTGVVCQRVSQCAGHIGITD